MRTAARSTCPSHRSLFASDILILLAVWGDCTGSCEQDLKEDGTVGDTDLLALLSDWGNCS